MDLINEHGVAITLGECIQKAIPHFIASVKYNVSGQNATGKVHREQHIMASLTILIVLANGCMDTDYAIPTVQKSLLVSEALSVLDNESQRIQKLRQQCLSDWKKLEINAYEHKIKQQNALAASLTGEQNPGVAFGQNNASPPQAALQSFNQSSFGDMKTAVQPTQQPQQANAMQE